MTIVATAAASQREQDWVITVARSTTWPLQSRFACLLLAFPLPLWMKCVSRSMGSGKMMVEFFSAEIELRVYEINQHSSTLSTVFIDSNT